MDPTASLKAFYEDIPSLGLLGSKYFVEPSTPFVVDPDVQLVCKYLKAFKTGGSRGIDRLYKDGKLIWYTCVSFVSIAIYFDRHISNTQEIYMCVFLLCVENFIWESVVQVSPYDLLKIYMCMSLKTFLKLFDYCFECSWPHWQK